MRVVIPHLATFAFGTPSGALPSGRLRAAFEEDATLSDEGAAGAQACVAACVVADAVVTCATCLAIAFGTRTINEAGRCPEALGTFGSGTPGGAFSIGRLPAAIDEAGALASGTVGAEACAGGGGIEGGNCSGKKNVSLAWRSISSVVAFGCTPGGGGDGLAGAGNRLAGAADVAAAAAGGAAAGAVAGAEAGGRTPGGGTDGSGRGLSGAGIVGAA